MILLTYFIFHMIGKCQSQSIHLSLLLTKDQILPPSLPWHHVLTSMEPWVDKSELGSREDDVYVSQILSNESRLLKCLVIIIKSLIVF